LRYSLAAPQERLRLTVHVPRVLNDGSPVPEETLEQIEDALLGLGGGYTVCPGVGVGEGVAGPCREALWLYTVDLPLAVAEGDVTSLAAAIRQTLDQHILYITASFVGVLEIRAPHTQADVGSMEPAEAAVPVELRKATSEASRWPCASVLDARVRTEVMRQPD